ncbi:MAG: TIGR02099 family protein [Betaproteobacteria bacterium RIFCSPLOWO2_12_FULL_62_13]|nr:MAG: TIGR02099 family protein [Betaproteobacteria bacterium RIFCSPLOWO2_12_FULL_62_13]
MLVAGFAFAAIVLSLRYWVLPNVERYREDIAQAVSRAANQRITIGKISANWDGMRPELVLENVTVFDRAGRPVLELSRVDNTLSWLSLPALEPRFHELEIYRPALDIRRDGRGVVSIAGIELKGEQGGGGFTDWLLRQHQIVVHEATVFWHDELRGAPPLELKNVRFLINNRGDRHRFALQAVAPKELAGTLDLRGDLNGATVDTLSNWNGKLFAELDYVNIAALRAWVPFPMEVPRGAGALRTWLTFSRQRLTDVIADVRLADVKTRLAQDLPEVDLTALSGRVAWKVSASGLEFSTSKLGLTTQGGLTLQPADVLLRLTAGKDQKSLRGELHANALNLEPLAALAGRVPLDAEIRKQLVDLSPQGSVFDVAVRWNGDWRAPAQYEARGRFQNLALGRVGRLPGFSGLSGNIDGSERGGTLYLNSIHAGLDMPLVFRDPLAFDTLTARIAWSRSDTETELRLRNISFSNPHLAGNLSGDYRTAPDSLGTVDLAASLTRADARFVARYIPLAIGKSARDWLDTAFLAGQSNDVSLRLKGNLKEFPFPDNKGGVLQVMAKITGGVLEYAEGWPRIENLAGELAFRGKRMEVNARQGTILGVRLAKVHAEIPDLKASDEILRVDGEAEGPASEFLAFMEKSPVLGMIDRFTEGMRAQGGGKLALKLEIPLRAPDMSKVAGAYQFVNNQIVAEPDLPPVEQANGRIEFTESTVRVPYASGIFLGGPVSITAATQSDSTVRINLQGRANIDNLRRSAGNPWWTQSLRGAADWKGAVVLRKKLADFVVESSLQGMASDLPAPFAKSAAEAVPLRYERKLTGPQQEQISLSYGDIASARLARRIDGGRSVVRRGTISFGGAAVEPERDGVWVSGALKGLDFDRWLTLTQHDKGELPLEVVGVDVKIGELTALNRTFHEVAVSGVTQGGVWQSKVSGREFEGTATWRPEGRGKLTARMKKLIVPPSGPAPTPQEVAARKQELPALDIVAEQFQFKDKALGKLELLAVAEERDWRIEKLRIASPESTLTVEGVLQNVPAQPRTRVNLHLDVNDIGKLLTRLGYPEGVRRGTAKLEGALAWAGGLQDFDYPALTGNLALDAAKGQFVKLDPGIGKLLGILSLQALPRRITLDFRDIFSDGFAFDQIIGVVKINRGIATTENFRIQGPSARVFMTGDVDLARETQKLRVKIIPSLSDSVSIAGALIGGPVAGVATFLAQKMLKDPLEQIISYEYNVTGTWSEPQVSKVERQAPPDANTPY